MARQALRRSGRCWTIAFLRESQASHYYSLEPKTCGIFWGLAVAEPILMVDYGTPHTCIEAACSVPLCTLERFVIAVVYLDVTENVARPQRCSGL